MIRQARRIVLCGQIGFLAFLLLAILIKPAGLAANDGISYYGARKETVLFFAFSIGALCVSYYLLAQRLKGSAKYLPLRIGSFLLPSLYLTSVFTPYDVDRKFHFIHVAVSIVIFALQIMLAVWIATILNWSNLNVILLILLALEGCAALFFVQPASGILLQAETAFESTFALMVYINLR